MSLLRWLSQRDRDLVALRRGARTALVMPSMFALSIEVIGNTAMATFAAFGAFAMLMLVDFTGPIRARVQAVAALAVAGGALLCLGTLASRSTALAAVAMACVGFCVLFAGVVSSVLAGATTSLLLAFILAVSLSAPASAVPDRLAGWGVSAGAAVLAMALLWPAPTREPVRGAAIAGCRAIAARLRLRVANAVTPVSAERRDAAVAQADAAVDALHSVFFATAYRPTGLSTSARAIVRLVDELRWLNTIVVQTAPRRGADPSVAAVNLAAATLLERGADVLDAPKLDPDLLRLAIDDLSAQLRELEHDATSMVPAAEPLDEVVSALDPSFRAQELGFVVLQIASNIDLAAAADRRSWLEQVLGRRPAGLSGPLAAAQERAGSHVRRESVWLQNSVRGAAGLGLAVTVASLSGVQHAFWVVLGTLSVLRSNALSTGQSVLHGLLGTAAGFVVGAALVVLVGTDTTVLWVLLPPAVLLAGLAPAAVSFAAGQAAFTLTLLILYNILAPAGWQVGLVRIEDVALGGAVSLAVGVLFWPRGAGGALGKALAAAYRDSVAYLAAAVRFGLSRCDSLAATAPPPMEEAARAAAAGRRLDDAFRNFLAERGTKRLALADATSLTTGVAGLRLAADAVLDLWRSDDGAGGDRTAARRELLIGTDQIVRWYEQFAASLVSAAAVPEPSPLDARAASRLVAAVGHDLLGTDGTATATAVRMIWTSDHLDAARRLEATLAGPAAAAVSEGVAILGRPRSPRRARPRRRSR